MDSFTKKELEIIADKLLPREVDFIPFSGELKSLYHKVTRMIDKIDAKTEFEKLRGFAVYLNMDYEHD